MVKIILFVEVLVSAIIRIVIIEKGSFSWCCVTMRIRGLTSFLLVLVILLWIVSVVSLSQLILKHNFPTGYNSISSIRFLLLFILITSDRRVLCLFLGHVYLLLVLNLIYFLFDQRRRSYWRLILLPCFEMSQRSFSIVIPFNVISD